MADFQLQYADATGQVHNLVVQGTSDQEVRERFSRQGYLVYKSRLRAVAWRRALTSAAVRSSTSKSS